MLTLLFAIRDRLSLSDDRGASMVEYALLVVLIAIIAIVAIRFAGTQVSTTFSTIGNSLASP
jgi:Flp pilus assembly pilin Flp